MTYGFAGYLGVAKEVTWGTPVAATAFFEALSENIVTNMDRFDVKNIVGGAMYEADDEGGLLRYQGEIVAAAHPQILGHFLRAALGIQSLTIVGSSYFKYDYIPTPTDIGSYHALPAYSVEIYRDVTTAEWYGGAQIQRLVLATAPNQDLRMTTTFIAKTRTTAARQAVITFPTSPIGVFKFDTSSISLGGVAVDRFESFSLTFDNQLEGIPTLNNTREIARIHRNGPQLVRLNATVGFYDMSDLNTFINQTEQRVTFNITKPNSFALLIDIPRAIFSSFPVRLAGRNRVTVDFEMIGRFSQSSSYAVRMTLTTVNTF